MKEVPNEFLMGISHDNPSDVVEEQDLPEFDVTLFEGDEFDDEVS